MKCLIIFFIMIFIVYKFCIPNKKPNTLTKKLLNDGYLIVPNILSRVECDSILDEIKEVESGKPKLGNIQTRKNRKDMMLPVYRVKKYIKKIYKKTEDIWNYITPNPILCECSSLISYPGAKHQPWHSDTEFRKGDANLVSIGIVLDDVTEDMGPLHVKKGSNKDYGKKERKYKEIQCTANKGDMVVWLSSTVHRGSENISNTRRPVFYFSLLGSDGNRPRGATYSLIHKKKKIYMEDL